MNDHYKVAIDGLKEIRSQADTGIQHGEAVALAVIQTRATLAVAENLDALLKAQQTANAIAYAQLCASTRQGEKFSNARLQADKLISAEPGMAFATRPREDFDDEDLF